MRQAIKNQIVIYLIFFTNFLFINNLINLILLYINNITIFNSVEFLILNILIYFFRYLVIKIKYNKKKELYLIFIKDLVILIFFLISILIPDISFCNGGALGKLISYIFLDDKTYKYQSSSQEILISDNYNKGIVVGVCIGVAGCAIGYSTYKYFKPEPSNTDLLNAIQSIKKEELPHISNQIGNTSKILLENIGETKLSLSQANATLNSIAIGGEAVSKCLDIMNENIIKSDKNLGFLNENLITINDNIQAIKTNETTINTSINNQTKIITENFNKKIDVLANEFKSNLNSQQLSNEEKEIIEKSLSEFSIKLKQTVGEESVINNVSSESPSLIIKKEMARPLFGLGTRLSSFPGLSNEQNRIINEQIKKNLEDKKINEKTKNDIDKLSEKLSEELIENSKLEPVKSLVPSSDVVVYTLRQKDGGFSFIPTNQSMLAPGLTLVERGRDIISMIPKPNIITIMTHVSTLITLLKVFPVTSGMIEMFIGNLELLNKIYQWRTNTPSTTSYTLGSRLNQVITDFYKGISGSKK